MIGSELGGFGSEGGIECGVSAGSVSEYDNPCDSDVDRVAASDEASGVE